MRTGLVVGLQVGLGLELTLKRTLERYGMVWDEGQDDFWVYVQKDWDQGWDGGKITMELFELGPASLRPDLLLMEFPLGKIVCMN